MGEYKFTGDVDELSDEQRKFVTNVLEERGFKNVNINIQPVGKPGDNYAASVKRFTVEKDSETFKMIAKIAPKNEIRRTMGHVNIYFKNEYIMYTKVLPKFTELEINANIPEEERLRYATCYGAYMEEPNEIILLEDLQVPGFVILDRFISLTDENVRLVLKNFAKLHSLSYALKNQDKVTFEMFCDTLVNFWILLAEAPELIEWFNTIDADVQTLIDDNKYKKALENAGSQMMSSAVELDKIDSSSKFSVIKQGDSWTNNIMFRLQDDRTVECCMIDYQLSTQSSPVADLHYMIFNCTDHDTRMKYFRDWIDYYHSQLDKILTKFELKIDDVYPRYQLDADLKKYAKISLSHAVMLSTILVRETKDADKFTKAMDTIDADTSIQDAMETVKISNLDAKTIKKFKARLEGVVDSFIELGYL